ncbi:NAD-P-binding protein [Cantharellus anzutake]|uniref:NAD-P-binding protein n=1 Tax=Cantharellus anzutake TaxID=1750568 RepID=UPI001908F14B|nr:NAD-P-binding protein [Cantharellus anzutake]KAF8333930.1 NAD-P-binding protein [Cantharellus anzutake]
MSVAIPPRPPIKSTEVFKKDIFEGKVLFCTGGPSGICKAMTKSIMSHGADAIIIGRKVDKGEAAAKELSNATGQRCVFAQADVREPEQLKAAAKKCIDTFGKIDFVICGAAGNFLAPISGLSENAFATVVRIDTLGTFNTIKATLPHVRRTRGSYIHVSATLHYYGTPYQAHVSAAKAGVDALSNVLAVEEGPRGVRSNVIAPGPILGTEGMDRLTPVGKKDAITRSVPLQRQGGLDDVPNTAVFLFSEAANWVTGQIIAVDGGAMHTNKGSLPYPDSVLDPEGATKSIRAKM